MSGINGDKARFHRRRKKKIQRRIQQREMFGSLPKQKVNPAASKSKEQKA